MIRDVQNLKPQNHHLGCSFVDWALFYCKIVFSDEAHFQLNGFVNKYGMGTLKTPVAQQNGTVDDTAQLPINYILVN